MPRPLALESTEVNVGPLDERRDRRMRAKRLDLASEFVQRRAIDHGGLDGWEWSSFLDSEEVVQEAAIGGRQLEELSDERVGIRRVAVTRRTPDLLGHGGAGGWDRQRGQELPAVAVEPVLHDGREQANQEERYPRVEHCSEEVRIHPGLRKDVVGAVERDEAPLVHGEPVPVRDVGDENLGLTREIPNT